MSNHVEEPAEAWEVALPRDAGGFSLVTETRPGSGTFFVMGPDDLAHSAYCAFVEGRGILPCSCDASRAVYPRPESERRRRRVSWWYRCWMAWAHCRVSPYEKGRERVPWPVEGPDGDPWIEGRDYFG